MNVRFFKDGQEIDIKDLDIDFARTFFDKNPFGDLLMKTLQLAKDALNPEEEVVEKPNLLLEEGKQEENLFKEEPQCTGNPLDCPVCGQGLLAGFEEALEALKSGERVTRKSWLESGQEVYLYYVPPATYPSRTEAAREEFGDEVPYSGYFALRTILGYVTPYNFQHADLLAEDWLLISNED